MALRLSQFPLVFPTYIYIYLVSADEYIYIYIYKLLSLFPERQIGLAGQRLPRTKKVPGSIPDLNVSMQWGLMLKM